MENTVRRDSSRLIPWLLVLTSSCSTDPSSTPMLPADRVQAWRHDYGDATASTSLDAPNNRIVTTIRANGSGEELLTMHWSLGEPMIAWEGPSGNGMLSPQDVRLQSTPSLGQANHTAHEVWLNLNGKADLPAEVGYDYPAPCQLARCTAEQVFCDGELCYDECVNDDPSCTWQCPCTWQVICEPYCWGCCTTYVCDTDNGGGGGDCGGNHCGCSGCCGGSCCI